MTMSDVQEIEQLVYRWGHTRDEPDWETLAGCFQAGATIHISWISDTWEAFIEGSKRIIAARKPGEYTKHVIAEPWVRVAGARAVSRCHVLLYSRAKIDGHELDFENWFRFFDLLEKRGGRWGLVKRTAVYEKDRMEPVDPRGLPASFYEGMDLSAYPPEARFLCFRQARSGGTPRTDMVVVGSAAEAALVAEEKAWLAG